MFRMRVFYALYTLVECAVFACCTLLYARVVDSVCAC